VRRSRRVAALLLAAALLPTACAKQNAREAAAVAGRTQSVTIDVVNDAFRPWVVKARLGRPLLVRLRNKGLTAHTFTVYDRDVDVVLRRGERRTVTIPPPTRPVTWRFVCRYHDAGGMHGGLVFGRPPPGRVGPP
jgi:plastocyanin